MAYPIEFRMKVVEACERGNSIRKVAEFFGISTRTVVKYRKIKKENGEIRPAKAPPGAKPKLDDHAMVFLHKLIDDNPAITLESMRSKLRAELGIVVGVPAIHRRLAKAGITFKKKRHVQKSATPLEFIG